MQSTELTSNVTQATFLEFFDEYQAACEAVTKSLGERREVMKRIESVGIVKQSFLTARKLADISGERRQQEFFALHTYMGLLGKPLTLEAVPPPPDGTIGDHQRRKVESDGFSAGRHGHDRQTFNKWAPGSLLYQVFDDAWVQGQEALEEAKAKADGEAEEPKRRGRPPGSRNKPRSANGAA
jgi:hypothetical protein